MKRCFIALDIQRPTRERLTQLQQELRAMRVPRGAIKPVAGANLHLTLKFLGATADAAVPELIAKLSALAERVPAMHIEAHGVSAFPSVERPKVIFAAVSAGHEPVVQLVAAIEAACEPLGFAREERPHTPHVTIARVQGGGPGSPLPAWLQQHRSTPIGPVDGTQIVLYESLLGPRGATYKPLAQLRLTGAADG